MIENNLQNRLEKGLKYLIRVNGKAVPKYKNYSDSIDKLFNLMYDSLAEKRGLFVLDKDGFLIKDDILEYGYPSVIRAVKFLRNLQYHEIVDVPTDYRTDVKSFGNLFTLSSKTISTFQKDFIRDALPDAIKEEYDKREWDAKILFSIKPFNNTAVEQSFFYITATGLSWSLIQDLENFGFEIYGVRPNNSYSVAILGEGCLHHYLQSGLYCFGSYKKESTSPRCIM